MRRVKEFTSLPVGRSGIYQIRNLYTEDFYIGSTQCFKSRFTNHLYDLRRRKHSNQKLQLDFNKFGESGFAFEVLEDVKDLTRLRAIEQKYIDENSPYYNNQSKSGYSIGAMRNNTIKPTSYIHIDSEPDTPDWHAWVYGGQNRPNY